MGPRWSDEASDEVLRVGRAVAELPLEKRVVVMLHFWRDYTADHIGALLDLPLGRYWRA